MNLNDERVETPVFCDTFGNGGGDPQTCRVVYIHPENRFYTVEFKSPVTGETFRQSFYFADRRGTARKETGKQEDN